MAVTKQNNQPVNNANTNAMSEAMAQAMAHAQQQAQAQAQAQAQESATDDQIAALIAVEKERAAVLQQQLLQQMAAQMAAQMLQQQAPAPTPAPAAPVKPELDRRLMAILAMCPYESRNEARDWVIDILGCKPHDYVVTEGSLEEATTKARAYLVKLSKQNKELKKELLDKEVKEALWGVASPKEYAPAQRVDSPAVYRPSSQPIVVSKPLFERPVRTYSPPQEVYVVRENQMRSSQNSEFWEDAVAVTAGLAVAGVVGYGIYKLVEHFMED